VRVGDLQGAILDGARQMDLPGRVAEVVAQLTDDRRLGEDNERDAALGLVAVDGFDEPDAGGLTQIIERLAPARVAAGKTMRVGEEGDDDLLPRLGVARCASVEEQAKALRRDSSRGPRARMRMQGHPISFSPGAYGVS
jgi:hypothetical protein